MVLPTQLRPPQIEARLQGFKRVWVVGYNKNDWPIAPEPGAAVRGAHVDRDWIEVEGRSYGVFIVTLYDVQPA